MRLNWEAQVVKSVSSALYSPSREQSLWHDESTSSATQQPTQHQTHSNLTTCDWQMQLDIR